MVVGVGMGVRAEAEAEAEAEVEVVEAEAEAEAEAGVVRGEKESLADWRIFVIESPMLAISRRTLWPLSTVGS